MTWIVILAVLIFLAVTAYIYYEENLQWEDVQASALNHYESVMNAASLLNSKGIKCRYHNVGSIHAEGCSNAGTTMYLQVAKKDANAARQLLSSARK